MKMETILLQKPFGIMSRYLAAGYVFNLYKEKKLLSKILGFLNKTGNTLSIEIIIKVSDCGKFVPEHFLFMVLRQGLFVGGSSKRFWAFPFL